MCTTSVVSVAKRRLLEHEWCFCANYKMFVNSIVYQKTTVFNGQLHQNLSLSHFKIKKNQRHQFSFSRTASRLCSISFKMFKILFNTAIYRYFELCHYRKS